MKRKEYFMIPVLLVAGVVTLWAQPQGVKNVDRDRLDYLQDKDRQEWRQAMKKEAGLSMEQVKQLEQWYIEREKAIDAIDAKLSEETKKGKRRTIKDRYDSRVQTFLPSAQYAKYETVMNTVYKHLRTRNEILNRFRKEYHDLRKPINPPTPEALRTLEHKYELQLIVIMELPLAKRWIEDSKIRVVAKDPSFKSLNLSNDQLWALSRASIAFEEKQAELYHGGGNGNLKSFQRRRTSLIDNYQKEVRTIVGEENYRRWTEFRDSYFDRAAKNQFGLSDVQLRQYKEICNRAAIERMKLKRSSLTSQEKEVNRRAVDEKEQQEIRKLLTAEQYAKYSAYMEKLENGRKERQRKFNGN